MLKDADVRGCWPSPRWPLGPSRPGFTLSTMPLLDTMTLARSGPQSHLPRAAEKPASQGPTHDCPPVSVAWAAQSPPATLGDPRAGSRKLSPSVSRLQGRDCDARWALALIRPQCAAQALSLFLRIPEEERNQRLGIEKQG